MEEAFRILSEEVLARLEVDTKHLQFSRLSKIYLYVNSIIKGKNIIHTITLDGRHHAEKGC